MKRWLFLAIIALMTALHSPAPSADSPWVYGIHWYGDPNSGDVEAMTGGKPVWVLENVNLYEGGWSMNDQAAKFQAIANKGHTIVIRLQPRWGWSIPAPAERAQYLNDVQAAAQQAANFCHTWQIGNEMNLYDEYGGGVLTAADYISFYKEIRNRIKLVTSPLGPQTVLVGPISPGAYYQEVRHTDGLVYLGQMADGLTQNDTDGFALHAYGAPWMNSTDARNDLRNGYSSQLQIIDNKGFCNKPAYILEWNRQTNPITSAAEEQQSAQFLLGAFQDLQTWNNTPGNHPIVCAAWFIYPDMPGWEIFSIRKLRDYNARGAGTDLWDAFQSAATLNIAAGSQAPACNVVNNGSFENGFTAGVGNGWTSYNLTGTPTFGATTYNKYDGATCQYWARTDTAAFNSGVYQRVATVSGMKYSLSAWIKRQSTITGQIMAIGYDLTGGTSATSANVTWIDLSAAANNTWTQATANITATGSFVTIFAKGGHTGTTGGTNAYYYVDAVKLQPLGKEAYWASYVSNTFPATVTAGSQVTVSVTFKNDGASTWTSATRLGTSNPRDRNSPFYLASNWVAANRPTPMDQASVPPGSNGTFSFIAQAPATAGTYAESYELVQEGVSWFNGTGDNVIWNVTVVAPTPSPSPSPSPTASPTPSPSPSPTATPTPSPSPTPVTNLVANGDFEGTFAANGVATSWTSWTSSWSNPVTFGRTTFTKYDGAASQFWGRTDALRCHGGVYQRITGLTTGGRYRIQAKMRRFAGATDQWLEFGHDLAGGTNAEAAGVVYTKLEGAGVNVWASYDVTVTATGSAITLFAKGGHYNEDGSGNNYFYVDAVTMQQVP